MNIITPITALLFVLNANALHSNADPYQTNFGIGRFDQDVDLIDSLSDGIRRRGGSNGSLKETNKVDNGLLIPKTRALAYRPGHENGKSLC